MLYQEKGTSTRTDGKRIRKTESQVETTGNR